MATITIEEIRTVRVTLTLERDYLTINEKKLASHVDHVVTEALEDVESLEEEISVESLACLKREFDYELDPEEQEAESWQQWGDYLRDEERMLKIEYETMTS